ncbi:hypothetical protein DFH09DRAFT_1079059 [Mycena vulgaris]|nr:hypothetical protein DFH09DRAFT_1079059 [Mycena vulgaris]
MALGAQFLAHRKVSATSRKNLNPRREKIVDANGGRRPRVERAPEIVGLLPSSYHCSLPGAKRQTVEAKSKRAGRFRNVTCRAPELQKSTTSRNIDIKRVRAWQMRKNERKAGVYPLHHQAIPELSRMANRCTNLSSVRQKKLGLYTKYGLALSRTRDFSRNRLDGASTASRCVTTTPPGRSYSLPKMWVVGSAHWINVNRHDYKTGRTEEYLRLRSVHPSCPDSAEEAQREIPDTRSEPPSGGGQFFGVRVHRGIFSPSCPDIAEEAQREIPDTRFEPPSGGRQFVGVRRTAWISASPMIGVEGEDRPQIASPLFCTSVRQSPFLLRTTIIVATSELCAPPTHGSEVYESHCVACIHKRRLWLAGRGADSRMKYDAYERG